MVAGSNPALRVCYPALFYLGLFCAAAGIVLRSQQGDDFSTFTLSLFPGLAAMIAAKACAGILLYRSWRCIERHSGRFDPKRRTLDAAAAVVLTYVPIVNFVGAFFSLGRLPVDLNWLARAAGVEPRAPGSLGYAVATMAACTLIPLVGPFIGLLAGVVLLPPLIVSCSAVADSIEGRLDSARPEVPPQP